MVRHLQLDGALILNGRHTSSIGFSQKVEDVLPVVGMAGHAGVQNIFAFRAAVRLIVCVDHNGSAFESRRVAINTRQGVVLVD